MSIKFINPTHTFKIVSMNDGAIDHAASNLAEYAESYDVTHLKFLEGEAPTYFEIKNAGSTELVEIQQDHYLTEMPKVLPGMTMATIKNLKVKVTPVRTGEMLIKYFRAGCKKYIDGTKETEINDETINTIPPMIIQEIGSFIMGRSILSDSKKK